MSRKESFRPVEVKLRAPGHDTWASAKAEVDTGAAHIFLSVPAALARQLNLPAGKPFQADIGSGRSKGEHTSTADVEMAGLEAQGIPVVVNNLEKVVVGLAMLEKFFVAFLGGQDLIVKSVQDHASYETAVGGSYRKLKVGLRSAGRSDADWVQLSAVVDSGFVSTAQVSISQNRANQLGVRVTGEIKNIQSADGTLSDFKVGRIDLIVGGQVFKNRVVLLHGNDDMLVVSLDLLLESFFVLFVKGCPVLVQRQ